MQKLGPWRAKEGFNHSGIDSDEKGGTLAKGVPILIADGKFHFKAVARMFKKASAGIDPEVCQMVNRLIRIYARR